MRRGGRRSQRAEILDAAVELFAKGGSRSTPLAAIAERIGVTAPAITHHFGTKHALFLEVVAVTDQIDEVRMTSSEPGKTALDRISGLRSWARQLTTDEGLANLSRLSVVMRTEAIDEDFPAHDHFVARERHLRQQLTEAIEAGKRDGSIRADLDAFALAVEIMSFMQGAVRQWHLDPSAIDLVSAYDRYFDKVVADAAATRSGDIA